MTNLQSLSVVQLRKVVAIKEQIERLEAQLNSIGGGSARPVAAAGGTIKRRKMSASARARIAAAQRLRWSKIKGRGAAASPSAPAKKSRKRKVSAATKAKLAAIAKARWAKAKASGKAAL